MALRATTRCLAWAATTRSSAGSGDDNLFGGYGDDAISAGPGFDIVWAARVRTFSTAATGPATTSIIGNTALPVRPHGVVVDMAAGTASDNWGNADTFVNFERVWVPVLPTRSSATGRTICWPTRWR